MADDCSQCEALQAQLASAQREIERLHKVIRRLRRIMARLRQVCQWWLARARHVLSRQSGVPRGSWAFWRGVERVASNLLALLGGE